MKKWVLPNILWLLFAWSCSKMNQTTYTDDRTKPCPQLSVAISGSGVTNYTGIATITGTAEDGAGIESVYLIINQQSPFPIGKEKFNTNLVLTNGDYQLSIYAVNINRIVSPSWDFHLTVFITNYSTVPPVLEIDPSLDHSTNSTGNFTFCGSAEGTNGIEGVYCSINQSPFVKIGSEHFTTNILLETGPNLMRIFARDFTNNCSFTNSLTIFYFHPDMLFNPGFEYWQNGLPCSWTNCKSGSSYETSFDGITGSTDSFSGLKSIRLNWEGNDSKYPILRNTNYFLLAADHLYVYSLALKAVSGNPGIYAMIKLYKGTNFLDTVYGNLSIASGDWKTLLWITNLPENADSAQLYIRGSKYNSNSGALLLDNIYFTNLAQYDQTLPIIEITNILLYSVMTNIIGYPICLGGKAYDNISPASAFYSFNGLTNRLVLNDGTWTLNIPTEGLSAGRYPLSIRASDQAGNQSPLLAVDYFLIENPVKTMVSYSFNTGNPDTNSPQATDPAVFATCFTNNGMNSLTYPQGNPSTGKAISCGGWAAGSPQYFEFTVSPIQPPVHFVSLELDYCRSSSGPSNLILKTSADGFNEALTNLSVPASFGASPMTVIDLTSLKGVSGSLTFRIYGTNASSGSGTLRIDNVAVKGKLE